MAVIGADVEQLRALARTLDQAAERLDTTATVVTGTLSSITWRGPDAERHRGQWNGQSRIAIRSAAAALREAANTLQSNATEQDQASAAQGGGGVGGSATVHASPAIYDIMPISVNGQELPSLADVRDFMGSNLVWPITWGTALGTFDDVGVLSLLDALGLASDTRLSPEDKIIASGNAMTDLVGGLIKGKGGPVGYLGGVAVQQWGDVFASAAKADFSPSGVQTVTDYIAKDPGGAFDAAAAAIKDYVPKLFSNLLP